MEHTNMVAVNRDVGGPSRRDVWRMFDRIAPRYDFLNRLLSFRRDVAWRRRMAGHLPPGQQLRILDLATGTADVLIELFARSPRLAQGVGIDLAEKMLEIGREKLRRAGLADRVSLQMGDAMNIPFEAATFDVVTIAFGIRNVADVPRALAEMYRVLRPGGRAIILEFSLPENPLLRRVYLLYFRHILPRLGGLISGDARAYRYLNRTVESFPYGRAFEQLMAEVGFGNIATTSLTFGIATIYRGEKGKA